MLAGVLAVFYSGYYVLELTDPNSISKSTLRSLGVLTWPIVWMALPIETILGQRRDAHRIEQKGNEIAAREVEL
jgi:hypothetical protein